MRYYISKTYETMWPGTYARNTFLIMDEEERLRLGDQIIGLIDHIEQMKEEGKLIPLYTKTGKLSKTGKGPDKSKRYWVEKDEEAIVFLKRMCFWTIFKESESIDPTVHQLETIVDKMLSKVYGLHYGKFVNWMRLFHDTNQLDSTEMRKHMDYKRKCVAQLKEEGLLPQGFPSP